MGKNVDELFKAKDRIDAGLKATGQPLPPVLQRLQSRRENMRGMISDTASKQA
jgi:hypothetical protein